MEGKSAVEFKMPKGTRIGAPVIRVRDIDEVLSFYTGSLGLQKAGGGKDTNDGLELTRLRVGGVEGDLITLKHDPEALPPPRYASGLYHFAVRVPDRRRLAESLMSISERGVAFDGFADHTVSESLYLHDPEGNGIEIYSDRGEDTWKLFGDLGGRGGASDMRKWGALNRPLDVDALAAEAAVSGEARNPGLPSGTVMGHIHLKVTNLDRSLSFYNKRLGFDITASVPEIGAAFLSAGGYHHHIGLNTWQSKGGQEWKGHQTGLDSFSIILPDAESIEMMTKKLKDAGDDGKQITLLDPDGLMITIGI